MSGDVRAPAVGVPYVVRNRVLIWLSGAFVAFFAASTLTTGFVDGGGGAEGVLSLVLVAGYLLLWWRAGWVHVRVEDRGLVVRNVWRSHELPWERIDRFERELRPGRHRVTAVLHDGTVVPLAAVTLTGDGESGWGADVRTRLRAHLANARNGRPVAEVAPGTPPSHAPRPARLPTWARIVLPLLVLVVALPFLAPSLPDLVAAGVLVALVAAVAAWWRRLGGDLGAAAWPLWAAATVVLALRLAVGLSG